MDWKYILTSFSGRLNRQPFWLGLVLVIVVELVVFYAVSSLFGTFTPTDVPGAYGMQFSPIGWVIMAILYIAVLWAGLALQIKRWHDRDKSGWWVLISLVPLVGAIWVIVECGFLAGTPGQNRFGPDPLAK